MRSSFLRILAHLGEHLKVWEREMTYLTNAESVPFAVIVFLCSIDEADVDAFFVNNSVRLNFAWLTRTFAPSLAVASFWGSSRLFTLSCSCFLSLGCRSSALGRRLGRSCLLRGNFLRCYSRGLHRTLTLARNFLLAFWSRLGRVINHLCVSFGLWRALGRHLWGCLGLSSWRATTSRRFHWWLAPLWGLGCCIFGNFNCFFFCHLFILSCLVILRVFLIFFFR